MYEWNLYKFRKNPKPQQLAKFIHKITTQYAADYRNFCLNIATQKMVKHLLQDIIWLQTGEQPDTDTTLQDMEQCVDANIAKHVLGVVQQTYIKTFSKETLDEMFSAIRQNNAYSLVKILIARNINRFCSTLAHYTKQLHKDDICYNYFYNFFADVCIIQLQDKTLVMMQHHADYVPKLSELQPYEYNACLNTPKLSKTTENQRKQEWLPWINKTRKWEYKSDLTPGQITYPQNMTRIHILSNEDILHTDIKELVQRMETYFSKIKLYKQAASDMQAFNHRTDINEIARQTFEYTQKLLNNQMPDFSQFLFRENEYDGIMKALAKIKQPIKGKKFTYKGLPMIALLRTPTHIQAVYETPLKIDKPKNMEELFDWYEEDEHYQLQLDENGNPTDFWQETMKKLGLQDDDTSLPTHEALYDAIDVLLAVAKNHCVLSGFIPDENDVQYVDQKGTYWSDSISSDQTPTIAALITVSIPRKDINDLND